MSVAGGRFVPEPQRKRIEAEALARAARELLHRAVALNREAQEIDDAAIDARSAELDRRETAKVAGVPVGLSEER